MTVYVKMGTEYISYVRERYSEGLITAQTEFSIEEINYHPAMYELKDGIIVYNEFEKNLYDEMVISEIKDSILHRQKRLLGAHDIFKSNYIGLQLGVLNPTNYPIESNTTQIRFQEIESWRLTVKAVNNNIDVSKSVDEHFAGIVVPTELEKYLQ